KIETHGEASLTGMQEAPKPMTEERDHARIGVGELNGSDALGPIPCVEGRAGDEELSGAHTADALLAVGEQLVDLPLLGHGERAGATGQRLPSGPWLEQNLSCPQ